MAATDIAAGAGRAPWTVIAYLPVWFAWTVVFAVLGEGDFSLGPTITGAIIVSAIWYGMIRGFRWAWMVALVLLILPLLGLPGAFARQLSLGFVSLVGLLATLFLLVHPDTRAWCSQVRPSTEKPRATGRPNNVESAVTEQGRRWGRH